jgi:hypothetical protein
VIGPTLATTALVLSRTQLANLEALTHAVAAIRFHHPSDQVAELDWNSFVPMAVDRVLRITDERALLATLHDLFAPIAPTVQISQSPDHPGIGSDRPNLGYLVRWRHEGLGPDDPFLTWREGRGRDLASLQIDTEVSVSDIERCKHAQLRAEVRGAEKTGEARLYAKFEVGGDDVRRFDQRVTAEAITALELAVPAGARRVRIGIEIRDRTEITLESLTLTCDGAHMTHIDVSRAEWQSRGATDLYTWETRSCGARPCLAIARRPLDTSFDPVRDVLDVEVANRLWLHVPVAVWSDGVRTLPVPPDSPPPIPGAASATAEHIATIASAWIVLSKFYPNLQDQQIDWPRELSDALRSASAARSTHDTYIALSRLMARIHDGHARAIHPDFPIDGILPITMRRFDDKIVIVGGYGDASQRVPIGSEVVAIDQVPALQAYHNLQDRVSLSSASWETWVVPLWLTMGRLGSLSTLRIRASDGKEADVILPRLSRDLYGSLVRDPRPTFGAELAPGIFYIDLEDLSTDRWRAAIPSLLHARAIVLDMRGYPSNMVFTMLGHFIDREAHSPTWQIPILESATYKTFQWSIQPMTPHLTAKLVVLLDGRAASAAETFLQIMHDHHLAMFVGEPSAGTNGNPNIVPLPGDFAMRFTGMRVLLGDGHTAQGRSIIPDVVVHPSLNGVRAGRDEILEAGLELARKLSSPSSVSKHDDR